MHWQHMNTEIHPAHQYLFVGADESPGLSLDSQTQTFSDVPSSKKSPHSCGPFWLSGIIRTRIWWLWVDSNHRPRHYE